MIRSTARNRRFRSSVVLALVAFFAFALALVLVLALVVVAAVETALARTTTGLPWMAEVLRLPMATSFFDHEFAAPAMAPARTASPVHGERRQMQKSSSVSSLDDGGSIASSDGGSSSSGSSTSDMVSSSGSSAHAPGPCAPTPVRARGASPASPSSSSLLPPPPPPAPANASSTAPVLRLTPQTWVLGYLDAFLERLREQEMPEEVDVTEFVLPADPRTLPRGCAADWQATFLSPVHTKLKRGPSPDVAARERQATAVRNKFNGVLPFYRVWQLRMEESTAAPFVMGRGTPPRPHQDIYERELSATKLFLRDYSRRRGLAPSTTVTAPVSETSVDVRRLLRPRTVSVSSFPSSPNGAASSPIAIRTQSLAPDRVVERRRGVSKSPPGRSVLVQYA